MNRDVRQNRRRASPSRSRRRPFRASAPAAASPSCSQDRAGKDVAFLAEQRDEIHRLPRASGRNSPASRRCSRPPCRRSSSNVDRDKVLKQDVELSAVYQTLQTFMGSYFVNYFNRFGRQWQVFVQAEGEYRTNAEKSASSL